MLKERDLTVYPHCVYSFYIPNWVFSILKKGSFAIAVRNGDPELLPQREKVADVAVQRGDARAVVVVQVRGERASADHPRAPTGQSSAGGRGLGSAAAGAPCVCPAPH